MSVTQKTSSPTTVRISDTQIAALDKVRDLVGLTRNSLIGLAVGAFLDHVDRTGKLPAPAAKRKGNKGNSHD